MELCCQSKATVRPPTKHITYVTYVRPLQAPHPVAVTVRHLTACARRWHGRAWRAHLFSAADALFSSRASGTLRAAELAAARRALACLRGYLAHAAARSTLRGCAAAAAGGLPRRRGLERPLCAAVERDGVLLNAAVDSQTGAAFLAERVEDFLAGAGPRGRGCSRTTMRVKRLCRMLHPPMFLWIELPKTLWCGIVQVYACAHAHAKGPWPPLCALCTRQVPAREL